MRGAKEAPIGFGGASGAGARVADAEQGRKTFSPPCGNRPAVWAAGETAAEGARARPDESWQEPRAGETCRAIETWIDCPVDGT